MNGIMKSPLISGYRIADEYRSRKASIDDVKIASAQRPYVLTPNARLSRGERL